LAKKKLQRFAEINVFPNVIQPGIRHPASDHHYRGDWNRRYFRNDHPLVLEIGCGKGEYTMALARAFPGHNHLGIDIKGDRLWKGARAALQEGLLNAAFLRVQAERLHYIFGENEVSGIYLTFPDPQLRESRRKKRLTSPRFLELYKGFLRPGSPIHLKTDNPRLYEYTLEVIREGRHSLRFATEDLYGERQVDEPMIREVRTHYETLFLEQGLPIRYIKFELNQE
jgi:tRNA (guanine-N7-)-methyltransferase